MNKKEQCQIGGCKNLAKYALYKTFSNGEKKWLHVCESHEQEIGQDNYRRAGGYLTAKELEDLQAMRGAYPHIKG